jgi:hypothetical protein
MDKSPVDTLLSLFKDYSYQEARALLGRFGLEGHAHTIPVRDLSGGQKARVVFATLAVSAPHIMVLDEPTNNLDIESIDALGEAISAYQGGVVLVSHDARLIRSCGCTLWVCDKQQVLPFDGDIDDYRASLIKDIHAESDKLMVELERMAAEAEAKRMEEMRKRAKNLKAAKEAAAAAAAGGGGGGGGGCLGGIAATGVAPVAAASPVLEVCSFCHNRVKKLMLPSPSICAHKPYCVYCITHSASFSPYCDGCNPPRAATYAGRVEPPRDAQAFCLYCRLRLTDNFTYPCGHTFCYTDSLNRARYAPACSNCNPEGAARPAGKSYSVAVVSSGAIGDGSLGEVCKNSTCLRPRKYCQCREPKFTL